MNHKSHLRPKEAASYLSLAEAYLAKLRLSGGGPQYCKIGRAVIYRTLDLDAWVAERLRQNTSEA